MEAKVELLHVHLPGDVARADSAFYLCTSKQISEKSKSSSHIKFSLLFL